MAITQNFSKTENYSTPSAKGTVLSPPIVEHQQFFSADIIDRVWEKAQVEFGFIFFKRDRFGGIIAKYDYGKQNQYGWLITHIIPVTDGGTDSIENLQPIHWKNVHLKGE